VQVPPELVFEHEGATAFAIDGALVPVHCAKQEPLVVQTVLLHEAETEPENPLLQVYEQDDPDAVVPEAHPLGEALATAVGGLLHAVEAQVLLVDHTPLLQLAEAVPANPLLQV
jgi:hypothetical protein